MPFNDKSTEYINSIDYEVLTPRLRELKTTLDDLSGKLLAVRRLRYADIDIEAEREAGRLLPDELYVPQHIIDTNIRREQSPYVQYITQSPRAVILEDQDDATVDLSVLEKDLTKKLRFDGWQLSMFANIDSFQQNGYSIMEIVQDLNTPAGVAHEHVQYGDFAFTTDTRDIQAVEMTARTYYFTKTRLIGLCGDESKPEHWSREQVDRVIEKAPDSTNASTESADIQDRSLYMVYKFMFRVQGTVHVGWACPDTCSEWLRKPRPLFLGRRKPKEQLSLLESLQVKMGGQAPTEEAYETKYPYILFPYLISENDTISHLKGRVFLDQDIQEAVSSLLSSTVTQARRAAGLYFSKDVSDPNDDVLLQKNIFFRSGCLINAKVKQFQLSPPDPTMLSAINALVVSNQNETSQVNFAVTNRKDSRKTAKEIGVAEQQNQQLSTVQVVLFSLALCQLYRTMSDIIKSRVIANLVAVNPVVKPLYTRRFTVKPSGDVDVIEKQQLIQQMGQSWPVIQNTPAGPAFLCDMLELMFPERAQKYIQIINQGLQAQQSQQAQQQQQLLQLAMSMATGIVNLSKKPEMFSETGKLHALPALENAATQLQAIEAQMKQQQPSKQ